MPKVSVILLGNWRRRWFENPWKILAHSTCTLDVFETPHCELLIMELHNGSILRRCLIPRVSETIIKVSDNRIRQILFNRFSGRCRKKVYAGVMRFSIIIGGPEISCRINTIAISSISSRLPHWGSVTRKLCQIVVLRKGYTGSHTVR